MRTALGIAYGTMMVMMVTVVMVGRVVTPIPVVRRRFEPLLDGTWQRREGTEEEEEEEEKKEEEEEEEERKEEEEENG